MHFQSPGIQTVGMVIAEEPDIRQSRLLHRLEEAQGNVPFVGDMLQLEACSNKGVSKDRTRYCTIQLSSPACSESSASPLTFASVKKRGYLLERS